MPDALKNQQSLYHQDHYLWLQLTAQKLKEGALIEIDLEHLICEIEAMGHLEELAVKHNLRQLLMQLLKWQHQPHNRSHQWVEMISEYRYKLKDLFATSQTLNDFGKNTLQNCYQEACTTLSTEEHFPVKHFPEEVFPERVPFILEQVLALDYFPE